MFCVVLYASICDKGHLVIWSGGIVELLSLLVYDQLKIVFSLTHSHTMTPFDAPGKQAF